MSIASESYQFTEMDFKNVQVYSAIESKLEKPKLSSEFTLAKEFMILATYNMLISMSEALSYLMLSRLGGNVFINGIVLSIA